MTEKVRADRLLVELGYFDSRSAAQSAIAAGGVEVNGQPVSKPSFLISSDDRIVAVAPHPWVSRGGVKLAHALEFFGVDPSGRKCLDIGASTGGFTDVLLNAGASSVTAVDVGHGQLHERLQADPRVHNLERLDARNLVSTDLPNPPSLLVCDASFIGLEKLLGVPLSLATEEADLIALFKPQFQVGRENIGKGGLVSSQDAAQIAERHFLDWLAGQGWNVLATGDSPILGGDGNAERLVHARKANQ